MKNAVNNLHEGLLNLLHEQSPNSLQSLFPLIAGLGLGMLFHAPYQVFTKALKPEELAAGTSAFFLVRFTGATTGLVGSFPKPYDALNNCRHKGCCRCDIWRAPDAYTTIRLWCCSSPQFLTQPQLSWRHPTAETSMGGYSRYFIFYTGIVHFLHVFVKLSNPLPDHMDGLRTVSRCCTSGRLHFESMLFDTQHWK